MKNVGNLVLFLSTKKQLENRGFEFCQSTRGHRTVPGISSFRIDPDTGALTQSGTVSPEAAPTFLSTDRTGRYVLSAYYQGAHAAVHPVGHDGAVGGPPIEWLETAIGAHAIQTDPSNTFAFVPHIDNRGGPNAIFQFKFDPTTGHLTPNAPPRVIVYASFRGIEKPRNIP